MNISIGDIHGKDCWKQLLDCEFDNCYFVGDYFDNYEGTSALEQINNFKEICAEARKNTRIHLCLGNHDFQYLRGNKEQYSGFQFYARFDIRDALEENFDLLKIVYQQDDYLISHAGISKTFLRNCCIENPLDINQRFVENRELLVFDGYNCYGDDVTQSPIWIRPNSLLKDKIEGYKQIVGHTRMNSIEEKDGVFFIDCLDTKIERLEF